MTGTKEVLIDNVEWSTSRDEATELLAQRVH